MFMITLSAELANDEKPPEGRRLAGIIVKNCLDSKVCADARVRRTPAPMARPLLTRARAIRPRGRPCVHDEQTPAVQEQLTNAWLAMDPAMKQQIKMSVSARRGLAHPAHPAMRARARRRALVRPPSSTPLAAPVPAPLICARVPLPRDSRSRAQVTSALASPAVQARQASAQVVAKIAAIELPRDLWPDLIDILTTNVTTSQSDSLKIATLECLGYICEEIVRARHAHQGAGGSQSPGV